MPNNKKSAKAKSRTPAKRKAKSERVSLVPRRTGSASQHPKSDLMTLHRQVCGLTDPFCEHAVGAKIPDRSNARTLAQTYRGSVTLSTGASGELAYWFYPQYAFLPYTSFSAGVLPAVTGWVNYAANPGAITGATSYRIVSCGFTLQRLTNQMNSSGVLQLRQWAGENLASYGSTDVSSFVASSMLNQAFVNMDTVSCIPARTSHPAEVFNTVTSDLNSVIGAPLNKIAPVTIYVSGGPANTGVLLLEFVINYEVMFDDITGLGQLATPPPKANPHVVGAASIVTSEAKSFFSRAATHVTKSLAQAAFAAIGSRLGIPPPVSVGAAAMIVD